MKEEKPILLIDEECTLCSSLVAFLERNGVGDQFHILSLFKEEGKKNLIINGLPENYDQSVVYIERGKAYLKSDAVFKVLKKMHGIWPVFTWLKIMPRKLRDSIYNLIAKNRHRIR